MPSLTPFLMFTGRAQQAIDAYLAAFPGSAIVSLDRYGEADGAAAGLIRHAVIALAGQRLQIIDSPIPHAFGFTPATSLHVMCADAAEVDAIVTRLADGGTFLMPLDAYPFSPRYAWLQDRFGVSWQVALAAPT